MKKFLCATTFFLVGFVSGATYGQSTVQIIREEPYMVRQHIQTCTTQPVTKTSPNVNILGAIAGGLLGNQVGGGNGKTAATAVGAVIGSQVGTNRVYTEMEQVCNTSWELVNMGKTVTFSYEGTIFSQIILNK